MTELLPLRFLHCPCLRAMYIIVGLTTVLYTFLLTLELIICSHTSPDMLLQFVNPDYFLAYLQIKNYTIILLMSVCR